MANSQVFTGKTVEDATEAGLKELGVSRENAEIEVLEEGKKKLIGKSIPAQVKITVKETLSDGARATRFLEGLFALLQEEVVPELQSEDEKIVINLKADSAKGLIGKRGETIDAVQTLAGAVANKGRRDYRRVVVDYENYRERREDTLKHVAEKLAAKAVRLGKRVRLEPMNPYERRIIHSALMDNEEVTTKSEGKEPARYVVITPKNARPHDNRGGRNNKYGEKKFGGKEKRYGEKKPYPKRELPAEDTPQSSGTSLRPSSSGSGFRRGGFSGFFGTYLGNSRDEEPAQESVQEPAQDAPEQEE